MTSARISKDGVFIAKPGRQIEEGEAALSFSPIGSQQQILMAGSAAFAAYNPGGDMGGTYNRAVVPFGTTFVEPPVAYCMANDAGGTREIALTMYLSLVGSVVRREPQIWWETTVSELRVYSYWALSSTPSASFVICRNEAS
ncbi:hypothetical protein [Brucella rhizosphaerae]|uniref:hypothetical protein n=1 Tax=Brucella rhizosphaerae TaxID=571254 RepID=UPI000B9874C6|nr:hypothetical protein [Brucella rhizosphaerae]